MLVELRSMWVCTMYVYVHTFFGFQIKGENLRMIVGSASNSILRTDVIEINLFNDCDITLFIRQNKIKNNGMY